MCRCDDQNRRAVRFWMFSSSGRTSTATGSWDEATSTLTLKVDAPPLGGSGTFTDRFTDDDHHEWQWVFKDGVADSIWFGIGAKRATATVVGVIDPGPNDVGVLEFAVSDGRLCRVEAHGAWGVQWATSHVRNVRVPVLFHADAPENARLADFSPRFAVPLIFLGLGCLFLPVGLLVWRRGWHPAES
jgi:hypothetical protein